MPSASFCCNSCVSSAFSGCVWVSLDGTSTRKSSASRASINRSRDSTLLSAIPAMSFWYRSFVIPSFAATSTSVGCLPSRVVSSEMALSISLPRCRMVRGIQSCFLAKSMTMPRILFETYVSNFTPLLGSYLSSAFSRVSIPSLTISSTWAKLLYTPLT